MDNFRHFDKRSRRRASLDGFVNPKSQGKRKNFDVFHREENPAEPATNIGDFKRTDGFHPAQQTKIETLGKTAAQPSIGTPLLVSGYRPEKPPEPEKKPKHHRIKRKWLRVSFKSAAVVTAILLITGGFLFAKGYLSARKIFKGGAARAAALDSNVDPSRLKGEGDGRINILLLGVGGAGHEGPDLTDTIIIASIDPVNNKAALLSIPRDLWVKMPNNYMGNYQKINAAYESGKYKYLGKQDESNANQAAITAGFNAIDTVLQQVLGIPIHYHVLVDFQAFKQAVDTVNGVTFDVPEQLYDPTIAWENHNNPVIAKAGTQTMLGDQALLYVRSRETSSDFARSERQRLVLLALKSKALSLGTLSNPIKISNLISAFGNNVRTDISLSDANAMYNLGQKISNADVQSIGLSTPPNNFVTTDNINGLSVVVPRAGTFDYSAIQNYVRNVLRDGYIAKENANILVLNGSMTPGLATAKVTELKSFGYNVMPAADAPSKNYQQTVLVDLTKGAKKYTLHYLEQRFGKAVTSLPDSSIVPSNADFVIILGANESVPN